jgi:hypothetical protein
MGFLKSSANQMISCDNVVSVVADIDSTNLSIFVSYATSLGADAATPTQWNILQATITYTSGASNEMELTEAEYQKIFADAIASMSGASGPAVSLPIVNNKVTATGAVIGAVTPSIQLGYTAIDV